MFVAGREFVRGKHLAGTMFYYQQYTFNSLHDYFCRMEESTLEPLFTKTLDIIKWFFGTLASITYLITHRLKCVIVLQTLMVWKETFQRCRVASQLKLLNFAYIDLIAKSIDSIAKKGKKLQKMSRYVCIDRIISCMKYSQICEMLCDLMEQNESHFNPS